MKVSYFAQALALPVILWANVEHAVGDTFGSGTNTFEIDFVTIGNPGNPDDTVNVANNRPQGGVDYTYQIGKYEISTDMLTKANAEGGLGIYHQGDSSVPVYWRYEPYRPAYWVSWYGAATFVNWLNESTGHVPAYKFDNAGNYQLWESGDLGYESTNPFRNSLTQYVLPDVDEWYKAAYYDGENGVYYDYPTGSNDEPDGTDFAGDLEFDAVFNEGYYNPRANDVTDVGVASAYGTFGQGGNVWEWEETALDYTNELPTELRAIRGGDLDANANFSSTDPSTQNGRDFLGKWFRTGGDPLTRTGIGFRVASLAVPEPSSLGDFNDDGFVDGADFLEWQRDVASYPLSISDLIAWESNYGNTVATTTSVSSASVPEPSSFALILLACAGRLMWRRALHAT